MPPLEPPDTFALAACEGWLELGNPAEAEAEWERLSHACRHHPAALEIRWHILARGERWIEAVAVGDELVACAPDSCAGWLHRAYAVRRASPTGLSDAWEVLRPAADLFPGEETVAYNLACYATQLGRDDEGWEWFLRALQISSDPARVRRMAVLDADLTPLLPRIQGLA
jgi:hypothetical protein